MCAQINCGLVIEEALFCSYCALSDCFPLLPLLSDHATRALFFSFLYPGISLIPHLSKSVGSLAILNQMQFHSTCSAFTPSTFSLSYF